MWRFPWWDFPAKIGKHHSTHSRLGQPLCRPSGVISKAIFHHCQWCGILNPQRWCVYKKPIIYIHILLWQDALPNFHATLPITRLLDICDIMAGPGKFSTKVLHFSKCFVGWRKKSSKLVGCSFSTDTAFEACIHAEKQK